MKKLGILIVTIQFNMVVMAQVIIGLQLPQTGLSLKSQLWNMTITNVGASVAVAKINVVMTDVVSGQQVFSGASNIILLQKGVKVVQYNDVVPVNYTVLGTNYNIDATPNGFLPIGSFNICYEVQKQNGEILETLAEECIQIEVEPVSPPLLNIPDDLSELEERRPIFSWIPPAPLTLFKNLLYSLQLVEVYPNQNPATAIQQNTPVFFKQNISSLSLQHPSSIPMLDTGKLYAWQVTASNNNVFIARSDIWTFKVKQNTNVKTGYQKETPYFKLLQEKTNAYYLCNGILKFEYFNEINDKSISIKIFDITGKTKIAIPLNDGILNLQYGQNFIDLDIGNVGGIISGHIYSVEITNSKQEVWSGKFEFNQSN